MNMPDYFSIATTSNHKRILASPLSTTRWHEWRIDPLCGTTGWCDISQWLQYGKWGMSLNAVKMTRCRSYIPLKTTIAMVQSLLVIVKVRLVLQNTRCCLHCITFVNQYMWHQCMLHSMSPHGTSLLGYTLSDHCVWY